ncbi:hypothetical protein [Synechococcus sp. LA31]|uniref:hypothetical protein n=1 Tax=Synechococcus sp. LA31 TaxID=2741953 RepID=UPI001BDD350A|nr:hypothetical protein [Synechococcus sp. LA31]QVV66755.1 hypothetical protein KJJ24_09685 [Synechococcus sp. LA31]
MARRKKHPFVPPDIGKILLRELLRSSFLLLVLTALLMLLPKGPEPSGEPERDDLHYVH